MREPNEQDRKIACKLYLDAPCAEYAAELIAAYREEIDAPLRAEIERLREALERVIDHAEDWREHYHEVWGERRKEEQDSILGDILYARAALAPSAPESRPSGAEAQGEGR